MKGDVSGCGCTLKQSVIDVTSCKEHLLGVEAVFDRSAWKRLYVYWFAITIILSLRPFWSIYGQGAGLFCQRCSACGEIVLSLVAPEIGGMAVDVGDCKR